MKLQNLLDTPDDERGVSPVIGVILMVAITVILAAVIGTFVLGLGENVESAPQASFDFSYNETANNGTVTIEHRGGDTIDGSNVEVRLDGAAPDSQLIGNSLAAGGQVQVNGTDFDDDGDGGIDPGDNIAIVTTGSDRQNVIARFEVPQ